MNFRAFLSVFVSRLTLAELRRASRDPFDLEKTVNEKRYEQNDEKSRKNNAERRGDSTSKTFLPESDICGTVDRDGAGGRFGDHRNVHHFFVGDPLFLYDAFILDERDHCISAAEGKETDSRKSQKQVQQTVSPIVSSQSE